MRAERSGGVAGGIGLHSKVLIMIGFFAKMSGPAAVLNTPAGPTANDLRRITYGNVRLHM